LQNLEGYTDVDVKVDPTQDTSVNRVEVRSELADDALNAAVEDKTKESYTANLENYTETSDSANIKAKDQKEYEPEKLEKEEIVDEIGLAISEALEDL
jgi:hypothetical protein